MYKIKIIYLLACLGLLGVLSSCEQSGFNEEEILELSQSSDLTVSVHKAGENIPAENVTVKLESNGEFFEAITDENGLAYFTNIVKGGLVVKLSGDEYFESIYKEEFSSNDRVSNYNIIFPIYSKNRAATIQGKVLIQTDLTSVEYEYPEGVNFDLFDGNKRVASGVTDAEGNFSIEVPTTPSGRFFSLYIPELSYDQQLYVLEDTVPVLKTAYGTIFTHDKIAQALPNTANIQAVINGPNYNNGKQAYIGELEVVDGEIIDVTFGEFGGGYSGNFDITIVADNGSGAEITAYGSYDGSICNYPDYYLFDNSSITIDNGGEMYPEYRPNANVTTNHPSGFQWSNCNRINQTFRISSEQTIELEFNYGSGTELGEIR